VEVANESIARFEPQFEAARSAGLRRKLGLLTERDDDAVLAQDLLQRMADNRADFTWTFRKLCDAAAGSLGDASVRELFANPGAFDVWAAQWRARLEQEPADKYARAEAMRKVNPAIIPRNHVVEAALDAATERQGFHPFEDLLDAVSQPYEERAGFESYATPAKPDQYVLQTFCGT